MNTKLRVLLLIALTLIAGWLRFSAIDFGLPDQLRPDEEILVPRAIDFEHDWNSDYAVYPTGQIDLIHGVLRVYATLTGAGRDLPSAFGAEHGARAFLIARTITAAMGTATVPVVYLAAAPVFGPVAAIASSAIMTVALIHVRDSKFAKTEVPAGLWLALSMLAILRIPIRGSWKDYALAGFFCGLAAATHYTSGAIAVGIFIAHLEARRREARSLSGALTDLRIYLAGVIALVTFIGVDPYFALDWKETTHTFLAIQSWYGTWNGGHSPAGYGWPWLLSLAMPAGLGVGLEIFLLAALLWAVIRPRPGSFALLAFILFCFWSLTGGHPQLEIRYLINPLLGMALLGGVFASDLATMGSSRLGAKVGAVAALLCGILLLVPSVAADIQMNHLLRKTDTRTLARKWIAEHVPQGMYAAARRWGQLRETTTA